ncbi:hypothetical protein TNCT_395271 [Trichonephila clavata]|uniref:Uncharacterized protein n=1 Tax=Trichonephila clavata TaxID=2740835 RepID=A0A8X6FD92_TRICU|nr:hypothetical protein TNCT_395271 [Trichonephila clavata]
MDLAKQWIGRRGFVEYLHFTRHHTLDFFYGIPKGQSLRTETCNSCSIEATIEHECRISKGIVHHVFYSIASCCQQCLEQNGHSLRTCDKRQ